MSDLRQEIERTIRSTLKVKQMRQHVVERDPNALIETAAVGLAGEIITTIREEIERRSERCAS